MASRKIVCDKTEIILVDEKNNGRISNFTYDQIVQIQISNCNEFSWFRKIPGEKIEVFARKFSEPFVFLKSKNRNFFEEYKTELKEFAKNNRITFNDSTDSREKEKDYQSQAI